MLLVYTHKITPRLIYIFKHIFEKMLEIPVDFSSNIEVFVAHSGPKISYTFKPLGKEFFIEAQPLLFEQGVEHISINVDEWKGIPCFFKSSKRSQIPYDIFAASFYLITRYEEKLIHLKDVLGRYPPEESLAYKNNFLTVPVVDHWVCHFYEVLEAYFPNFPKRRKEQPRWYPLFDIAIPYRYLQRSVFAMVSDCIGALSRLQLLSVFKQLFVLLRLRKDPYDNYAELEQLTKRYNLQPHFFILYADNTLYESTTSIYNTVYQTLIKGLSDFAQVSLLLSYNAKRSSTFLRKDKKNLLTLTHRTINAVRMHRGLVDTGKIYNRLVDEEIQKDFSMGYPHTIGFRAGTSVPFFYFDLSNELQLPLLINPVVATFSSLKKYSAEKAFAKLQTVYKNLPLSTAIHCIAFTNEILNKDSYNMLWQKQFINYLKWHARPH